MNVAGTELANVTRWALSQLEEEEEEDGGGIAMVGLPSLGIAPHRR